MITVPTITAITGRLRVDVGGYGGTGGISAVVSVASSTSWFLSTHEVPSGFGIALGFGVTQLGVPTSVIRRLGFARGQGAWRRAQS
ncbi:hypothetical protein Stsp01_62350 [Streptomyces sp. NBRC 13847]|nr:hypothetical protein Stsp01_62350 [Streptomyces sp. NBRC 13847]